MSASKTAEAARKAVAKAGAKTREPLTPDKAIPTLRNLRTARLFVTDMEMVDVLLAEYDRLGIELTAAKIDAENAKMSLADCNAEIIRLTETNQNLTLDVHVLTLELAAAINELNQIRTVLGTSTGTTTEPSTDANPTVQV